MVVLKLTHFERLHFRNKPTAMIQQPGQRVRIWFRSMQVIGCRILVVGMLLPIESGRDFQEPIGYPSNASQWPSFCARSTVETSTRMCASSFPNGWHRILTAVPRKW
ncbi:hypothetical protein Nepgr_004917 [Nepenthes gracilis]|uniref:Uncharacterized protein n=1 Tax=Nepenthes gracilis TaxID=150966 RepID=A0AAD3S263_NEPGR|nr:hypothetical protein Nepgr_004917 [Nepenthes gracilis]